MPRKPKTDKRLDKLFHGLQPEENARETKPKPKVRKEAPPPPFDPKPVQSQQGHLTPVNPSLHRQTSRLSTEVVMLPTSGQEAIYAANFQTGDNNWATMRLINEDQNRTLTMDEQLLIKQVADQLSLALENARLFQETQQRAQELTIINQVVSSASRSLDLENALQGVTSNLINLLGAQNVGIALMNNDKTHLVLTAETLATSEESTEIGLLIPIEGNPPTEEVIRTHKPVFLKDIETNPLAAPVKDILLERGTKNMLILPLLAEDEVIGTVGIAFYDRDRIITPNEMRVLETLSAQIASTVQRNRLFTQIAQSDSNFRALFSAMEDVVLVINNEGRYVQIAPTSPGLLIGSPESMLGKTFHELMPAETADLFLSKVQEALSSKEKVQFEYELSINNALHWFFATLTKLDELNVFWVARDITERKHTEEAIRRRNEYLAASAEIGKLVTSTLDLNTIFARTVNLINERFGFYHAAIFVVEETGFNAVLKEGTGAAGSEMKKKQHSLPLDDKSVVGKVAADGVPVIVNDTLNNPIHKVNPLLPETRAEAAIPLRVGQRVIGAIDIQSKTPDAFTEDEIAVLQTLADQIAVAIDNARSFELSQQAVMEMREIDRLKSQFLANMSHELRTPLNSIIGFSRVILKGIDGPVTELMQQDLTAIYNSGQHLLGLINDILDLAKIEAGKMELAFDEVNIGDLANSVLSTMSGLIKDKPIQMKKNIEPNLPTVRADAIRVRQVMINLLSNAAKFTDEGEITVDVHLQRSISGRNEIKISVTDTGPGIKEEDQAKLFLPFSQVDASPTRKTGGTGLGLSICQQLINMHGGRIGVESDYGKGSTFYFTLPLFRKESELANENDRVILAIDDDSQVIGLYERYLTPQGYRVIPLTEPAKAVERAQQLTPFAITLDIMMPGIDGWAVLESLKSDPITRNIPVIVCSIIEDLERGFSLGASDYLVKPILEEDLVISLDRLNSDGSIREVLVIDDNLDDLRLLGKMLNDDGRYKAVLAEGGRAGWNLATSGNPPHVIILDLFMPDMNGFQILEKLQSDSRLRDIPVIILSGMDVSAEQRKQLEEYGKQILTKGSFNEKELLTFLQRALDRLKNSNIGD